MVAEVGDNSVSVGEHHIPHSLALSLKRKMIKCKKDLQYINVKLGFSLNVILTSEKAESPMKVSRQGRGVPP